MEIGIFAKTYVRPRLEQTLDAIVADGFSHIQFNMQCAGLASMPDTVDSKTLGQISRTCRERGVHIAAISGTFNMIHPDLAERQAGLRRLEVLASAAASIGIPLISLCTGTRDRDNMWRHHPDNSSPAAWNDLYASMHRAVEIAEAHDVRFGIEPEPGNVVSDAAKARRLLDDVVSDRLGIILDPANILEGVSPALIEERLDEAFALLGDRILSVHGKDRDLAGNVVPAGRGIVHWNWFLNCLFESGFDGPILIHGISESEVPNARGTLLSLLATKRSDSDR